MNDPRFNKAIKNIKKISMTSVEKKTILERLMKTVAIKVGHSSQPAIETGAVKSPWTVYSFSTWIQTHRWISAVAVVVIVILAGNSAVLASYNALPGDTLYPIKVNVVEPIRVALAPTAVAKAEIQTELVQNRLQEAETLASRGDLTDGKEQNVNARIDAQVSDLTSNIAEVKKNSPEKADDIKTTLEASINAHERLLDVIALDRGEVRGKSDKNVAVVAATAASVAVPAAPAPSVSNNTNANTSDSVPEETRVMKTASRRTAGTSKSESKKNKNFSTKKASITSLIETTTKDLIATTSTATSSLLQETINNDARANLDRAQEKLQEAEGHDQNGNDGEAYSALIDSERSTKEAALFIKAKVRLEKERKGEEIRNSVRGGEGN